MGMPEGRHQYRHIGAREIVGIGGTDGFDQETGEAGIVAGMLHRPIQQRLDAPVHSALP